MIEPASSSSGGLAYALVTPVRNEEENLRRLAECVMKQTVAPNEWILVDNGSSDGTLEYSASLSASVDWVREIRIGPGSAQERGAPVVRAVLAGLDALDEWPDVVVKLDADVSFEDDHFGRLLAHFSTDPGLGIASSLCLEEEHGEWRPTYSTRSHARGAVRAYRRACLEDVMPLEPRLGWDGIDEIKAAIRGWRTATIPDVVFFHHRKAGRREAAYRRWSRQGETAYYMGYRPSYLVVRAVYRALREPAALAMLPGYMGQLLRRAPRYDDPEVRAWLRREQSLRRLPRRTREALGRAPSG